MQYLVNHIQFAFRRLNAQAPRLVAWMAALLIFIFSACSKQAADSPPPAPEEPKPQTLNPAPATVASGEEVSPAPSEPVTLRSAQRDVPPLPENPQALERLYYSGNTSPAVRVEIIRALGSSGTPASVDLLGRLFEKEKRFETKATILEVAGDLDKDLHRERILALLKSALEPRQTRIVREIALRMLADIEDPRAVTLLRSAQSDPDLIIKKVASEVLDDLTH